MTSYEETDYGAAIPRSNPNAGHAEHIRGDHQLCEDASHSMHEGSHGGWIKCRHRDDCVIDAGRSELDGLRLNRSAHLDTGQRGAPFSRVVVEASYDLKIQGGFVGQARDYQRSRLSGSQYNRRHTPPRTVAE